MWNVADPTAGRTVLLVEAARPGRREKYQYNPASGRRSAVAAPRVPFWR
jgi:hypothetical protein